jgi:hypothetical protein
MVAARPVQAFPPESISQVTQQSKYPHVEAIADVKQVEWSLRGHDLRAALFHWADAAGELAPQRREMIRDHFNRFNGLGGTGGLGADQMMAFVDGLLQMMTKADRIRLISIHAPGARK